MTRTVDYTQWVMTRYRLMQTVQVCNNCGHEHKGSVASEVYVLSERGVNGKFEHRSDKVSTILARYAYYLGGKPEQHRDKLPVLPCQVVKVSSPIEQCPKCFTAKQWLLDIESMRENIPLLPAEPTAPAGVSNLIEEKKKPSPSTKANPKHHKPRAMTLGELGKDLF